MESKNIKILAIDDTQDNLISLKALISESFPNALFLSANNGPKGIELAISENPDVILLDIIMPNMDGYEVCKRLKADKSTVHIPVLMLTAIKTDAESRIKGLNLGADAFLSKPIDHAELSAQVKVMLRIRHAEDKLREEKENLNKLVVERTFKLKESQKKYKALFDFAPLPYHSLNEDGLFLDVNPAWLRIMGYRRNEIIGKPYCDLLHPESKAHFNHRFPEFKECGYVQTLFKLRHKRGHYLDIALEGCIGTHPDGSFKQTYCVFQDITEKKQAEEALLTEQYLLHTLMDNSPDIIYFKDLNSHFIRINKAHANLFGLTNPEEAIGMSDDDFFAHEHSQNAYADEQKIINTGRPIIGKEEKETWPDGKITWVQTTKLPLQNKTGKITGTIGISRDITARIEKDKQLKLLGRAIDQNPTSIVITDKNGIIEYVNPKFVEVTGYSADEVIGENPKILQSGELSKTFYQELWDTILSGNNWQGEFHNFKKSGEPYWEHALISPVLDDVGEISHFVAVKEDITERKKMIHDLIIAKEKATESDRLKSAFLATMSHELRTPLNAIIGFSSLIDPEMPLDEIIRFSNIINSSGQHLQNIIEDIFDISLIESGITKINKSEENLQTVLETVLEIIKIEQKKTGRDNLVLNLVIPSGLPELTIYTDILRFKQVLLNLLKNALKFTQNGHIDFGFSIHNDSEYPEFQFFVKDSGIGIPKDMQEPIFETFMQVEDAVNRKIDGTGIGLSVSKKFIALLGGKIWVESKLGKGSVFYFTIPIESKKNNVN